MLYEVNNAFGQRHCYLIEAGPDRGRSISQSCAKAFHVSPFMEMAMAYDFELTAPGDLVRTRVRANNPRGEPF